MLEDIAKLLEVKDVLEQAKVITSLYNYEKLAHLLRKYIGVCELLRPNITWFATKFVALESVVHVMSDLINLFGGCDWINSEYSNAT